MGRLVANEAPRIIKRFPPQIQWIRGNDPRAWIEEPTTPDLAEHHVEVGILRNSARQ
jgi:hypothetical protein